MSFLDLLSVFAAISLWAGNIIAVKVGIAEFPPLMMTALRLSIVALLLLPFSRLSKKEYAPAVLLSVTFSTLHFSLMFIGLSSAEAGTGSILLQMGTPIAVILGMLLLKERPKRLHIIGLCVSLGGVAILTFSPSMPALLPSALLLGSALAWAVSNIIVKRVGTANLLAMMCWASLLGVPQVSLASWLLESGQAHALQHASWHAWLAVAYCAILSSILAYWIWYRLVARIAVSKIMPFSLLTPVFSVVLGILLLNDRVESLKIGGIVVTVAGLAFLAWPSSVTRAVKATGNDRAS